MRYATNHCKACSRTRCLGPTHGPFAFFFGAFFAFIAGPRISKQHAPSASVPLPAAQFDGLGLRQPSWRRGQQSSVQHTRLLSGGRGPDALWPIPKTCDIWILLGVWVHCRDSTCHGSNSCALWAKDALTVSGFGVLLKGVRALTLAVMPFKQHESLSCLCCENCTDRPFCTWPMWELKQFRGNQQKLHQDFCSAF